jgi:hypothetical protein
MNIVESCGFGLPDEHMQWTVSAATLAAAWRRTCTWYEIRRGGVAYEVLPAQFDGPVQVPHATTSRDVPSTTSDELRTSGR